MRLIWVLLAVQLGVYMAAWLLASRYIEPYKVSSRRWGESSACFMLAVMALALPGSIRANPPLYILMVLFFTQGFLSMYSAVASFFNLAAWSQRRLYLISVLVAALLAVASYVDSLQKMRMPLLLMLYGTMILVLLIRYYRALIPEFGRSSTWAIYAPGFLLAIGMIAYGVKGMLSNGEMQELNADSPLNYALALTFLAAAGIMNFTYLLRLGLRLVRNLKELSQNDPLTGIANRRAFDDAIRVEHERFVRSGRPYALISMDIDHFKSINDSFGHAAGDQVLVCVARQMSEHVRAIDTAARVGGEEFLLLLTDSDLDAARQTAERLRHQVAESNIPWNDRDIAITISLGVAQVATPGESIDNVMQRVDAALYHAKAAGRNCVVMSESGTAPHSLLALMR